MVVRIHAGALSNLVWGHFGKFAFLDEDDVNCLVDGKVKEVVFGSVEPHSNVVGEDADTVWGGLRSRGGARECREGGALVSGSRRGEEGVGVILGRGKDLGVAWLRPGGSQRA